MKFASSLVAFSVPLLISTAVRAQPILVNSDFSAGLSSWATVGLVTSPNGGTDNAKLTGTSELTQNISNLIIGSSYSVAFSFFRNTTSLGSMDTQPYSFVASVGGGSFSNLGSFTSPGGFAQDTTGPGLRSFLFIASAASEQLKFSATAGSQNFFLIDDVNVRQVPGPLPLLGVVAAFAWTRKFRLRIKDSVGKGASA